MSPPLPLPAPPPPPDQAPLILRDAGFLVEAPELWLPFVCQVALAHSSKAVSGFVWPSSQMVRAVPASYSSASEKATLKATACSEASEQKLLPCHRRGR